jgi:hypothetical protein
MQNDLEYAKQIDWMPAWSTGAPLPKVFSNGHETYLAYLTDENDAAVIATFFKSQAHRFGIVNDEAANGHPLYGKGLQVYKAHIIENSIWIAELKKIHQVHPRYSEKHWADYKHYLLFFHDDIFEVIALSHEIERSTFPLKDVSLEIARRLNS